MGWNRFLNMVREELGQKPTSTINVPNMTGDIIYQSYDNAKKCWLPEVINDRDYAGNFGNSLGGFRAKPKYGTIYIPFIYICIKDDFTTFLSCPLF